VWLPARALWTRGRRHPQPSLSRRTHACPHRCAGKSEAERLSALAAAKEAVLERYAQALALREPPDASAHLGDCSAGASRLPGVEQALALREAELAAALPSVDEAERLSEETARLHTELDEQRHATKRAEASNAPLQAKLDDCLRRQKDLRDQLGKSELERQRQMSAYQAELTNASKRLRASKSQNELLTRKFQEAQQPLQQPPPPAPPAFQQRSSSNALFGRDARRTL